MSGEFNPATYIELWMNMIMDTIEDYYRIETINRGIQLCFIDISLFVGKYIQTIDSDNFRREKSVYFDSAGALGRYFSDTDFQKINNFKILKKQVEWMAGKIAVKKLAALSLNENENKIKISAEQSGAPFLDDYPEIRISISHSERYAVAGIGFNRQIVAVDIEKIEEGRMQTIGRVAFSKKELEELKDKSDESHYIAWTVKEAFLKYIGKGFAEGLKKVEFLKGSIYHHEKKVEGLLIDSRVLSDNYAFTLIY